MNKDYECQMKIWPRKYKRKQTSCLGLTSSHEQKKSTERGEVSFAEVSII